MLDVSARFQTARPMALIRVLAEKGSTEAIRRKAAALLVRLGAPPSAGGRGREVGLSVREVCVKGASAVVAVVRPPCIVPALVLAKFANGAEPVVFNALRLSLPP